MNTNIDQQPNKANGKVMAGGILLLVGAFLLLKQLNLFFIPDHIDLWPLWLVFSGLWIGSRSNFQKSNWVVITALGVIFLLTSNIDNAEGFVWPVALIGFGFWIILRKKKTGDTLGDADYWDKKYKTGVADTDKPLADFGDTTYSSATGVPPTDSNTTGTPPPLSHDDILDATAIFGGVNKSIFSKSFRGGDITNIFGGTELDFTHADINGRAIIDLTQVFGGTKIIVPSNWQVIVDTSAIFAGTDDKRMKSIQAAKSDKVLIIKGVSIFAGLEIRSY
ncbi:LiaF domain-containing protein [Mucilaginibacter sp.]|uniref:LiaF transmembrane domain-containing protein n=1 Tax=Mucilaginibacter sp. TaxID=1882438 RepID=UPI0032645366